MRRNVVGYAVIGMATLIIGMGCASTKNLKLAQDQLSQLQKQNSQLQKQNVLLERQKADWQAKQKSYEKNFTTLSARYKKLEARMNKKLLQMRDNKNQAKYRQELYARLRRAFKSMVDSGTLNVKLVDGRIILHLPERILFALNSAKVTSKGQRVVAEISTVLQKLPHHWQVNGHTDTTGAPSFNWGLSLKRARAVLSIMLKKGMPPKQLLVAGYGQYRPIASNKESTGRSKNRRTEITLVPDLTVFAVPKASNISSNK